MSMPPIPLDQISKPVETHFDLKAAVESLDPTRHNREIIYQFSNGRTFKEPNKI